MGVQYREPPFQMGVGMSNDQGVNNLSDLRLQNMANANQGDQNQAYQGAVSNGQFFGINGRWMNNSIGGNPVYYPPRYGPVPIVDDAIDALLAPGEIILNDPQDETEDDESYDEDEIRPIIISSALDPYLSQIQSKTGKLLKLESLEMFSVCTDKSKINQLFFSLPPEHFESTTERGRDEDAIMSQMMEHFLVKMAKDKKIQLKEQVRKCIDEAKVHSSKSHSLLQDAVNLERRIDNYGQAEAKASLEAVIEGIKADPFWTIGKLDKVHMVIEFHSGNIVCSHINKNQNIDCTVDFGKFSVVWYVQTGDFRIQQLKDNIVYNGHAHPHVGENGKLCLGNAFDAYKRAVISHDIHQVLKIIQSLLQTYNPDSPYVSMDKFWAKKNPHLLTGNFIYQTSGGFWLRKEMTDHLTPSYFDMSPTPENKNKIVIKCQTFQKFNEQYLIKISDDLFIKNDKNEFIKIEPEWIYNQ